MTKRKKAMHAPAEQKQPKQIISVFEGLETHYEASLDEILKNSELDISFNHPVNPLSTRTLMDIYHGREVYVSGEKSSKPIFYHGRLEIDILPREVYYIRYKEVPCMPEEHDFSKIRRLIVMKK